MPKSPTQKPRRAATSANDNKKMVTLNAAGDQARTQRYADYISKEVPNDTDLSTAFELAQKHAQTNYWLRGFIPLKISILNYDVKFQAAIDPKKDEGKSNLENKLKLDQWLDSIVPMPDISLTPEDKKLLGAPSQAEISYREKLLKFVHDAWQEYIIKDCAIAYWSENLGYSVLLAPEACTYQEVAGVETLKYRHGLSKAQIKLLPTEDQARFSASGEVIVDAEQGDYFRVFKTTRTGTGLSFPSLRPVFRTLSTMASMEIGESAYAYLGRLKVRHHKVGHPIESGPKAGFPTHFWNVPRGTAIRKIFENKDGVLGDFISNFDHDIDFPHEKLEYFTEAKWKSPEHRLIAWGGPLAAMMVAEGVRPFLARLLRAEAENLRRDFGMFLKSVIRQAFRPPVPIEIRWGSQIFNEANLQAQLLQFGVSSGAVSHRTFREMADFDDQEEQVRKEAEAKAKKSNPEMFMPAYDPAHGDPAAAAADKGGKPKGGKDADNKQE